MMANWLGISNTDPDGGIPPSVKFSFYCGAVVFLGAVLWTVFRTKEYSPQEMQEFNEYEADIFAVRTYARPESMISALKRLSVENLSNLTPHPIKVFIGYSHPPVLERIRAIRKWEKDAVDL